MKNRLAYLDEIDVDKKTEIAAEMYYKGFGSSEICLRTGLTHNEWKHLWRNKNFTDLIERYRTRAFEENKNNKNFHWYSDRFNGDVVYLIGSDNGLVKIGITKNIRKRFRALEKSSPVEIKIIGIKSTPDKRTLESELHDMFQSKRVNGEWFLLDKADMMILRVKYGFCTLGEAYPDVAIMNEGKL